MAAGRIVIPQWMPALSANGIPIPNAKIFFYQNNTTTLKTVYADEALTTPLANPVAANSAGHFPNIWGDDEELYSATVSAPYGPPGAPFTYDDLRPGTAAGGSSGVNRGAWNALTNTPALTDGTGEEGDFYTVSVAGITDLDGNATWKVGDQALFKGGAWTRVPNKLGINLGYWDASANIPVILPGAGAEGDFYTVSVPGNTVINGFSGWVVGDIIRFTSGMWVKAPPPYRRTVGTGTTVARPAYLKMGDRISIRDWIPEADADGVTPCADKFQQAFTEMIVAGRSGELWIDPGVGGYNIEKPVAYTGKNPIKLIGGAPMSGFPYGAPLQAQLMYTGGAAYPGSACLTFQTNGGNNEPLRGVELHNLFIREPSNAMSGRSSGVHGVRFKGVVGATISNVGVYGFARGMDWNDDPPNPTSEIVRCADFKVYGLTVMNAAEDRVSIAGSAEIIFFKPQLGGTARTGYRSDMRLARGARGGRADHVHAHSGTFLGKGEYNLLAESGIYNNFNGCAFEGGTVASIYITHDTPLNQDPGVALTDCSIDAAANYAVDVLAARVSITNLRTQQLIAAEGGSQAVPAIRIRGHASTPSQLNGSEIRGGVISTSGPTCVQIENAAQVSIIGGAYRNRVSPDKPSITVKASCSRVNVLFPNNLEGTTSPLFENTDSTYVGTNGIMIRGAGLERPLPVITGTLDASGQATPAHGVGNQAKITEVRAYAISGAGARYPIPVEYWDNAGVRLNGGTANASRAFELYVTRIP